MSHHRPWNRLGALLIASLLVIGATPACLAEHCGMPSHDGAAMANHGATMDHGAMVDHGAMQDMTAMSAAMDCCTDSCPMTDPEACETVMENEESGEVASTAAVPSFQIAPAVVTPAISEDSPSGPSHLSVQHEVELDALDSSPPVHLLNSQFLI